MSEWSVRRAKKQHRCNFCNEPIAEGTQYAHCRLTPWDHPDNDGFFTWRAHPFCREMWVQHIGAECEWEWGDDPWQFKDDCEQCAPDRQDEYPWDRDCSRCDGTGMDDEGVPGECYTCKGTGSAYRRARAA